MEQALLIATAGHVDHGKSTLVRALTGIDPDRLPQEKSRAITIELGFAHVRRQGRLFAFIDVPGHERYAANMLAGVGALDAVLLLVAADEGPMPQTIEHLRALRFLKVPNLAVVITKSELADSDMRALVGEEVAVLLAEMGPGTVPLFELSAARGTGLDSLWNWLASLEKPPAPAGSARLALDRSFVRPGVGRVVTGTLICGRLERGMNLYRQNGGEPLRLRELHRYGEAVEQVTARDRAALNLVGAGRAELRRGCQLFALPLPYQARRFWVRLEIFVSGWSPSARKDLHFHHFSAERIGRLAWLSGGWAQLEVREPLPLRVGDRLLIRDGSPLSLVAGAWVLDPDPPALRRGRGEIELRSAPETLEVEAWLDWWMGRQREVFGFERLLELWGLDPTELLEKFESRSVKSAEKKSEWRVETSRARPPESPWWQVLGDGQLLSRVLWEKALRQARGALRQAHRLRPHWQKLPLRHLRAELPSDWRNASWLGDLLATAQAEGWLLREGDWIWASQHRAEWSETMRLCRDRLEKKFDSAGFLTFHDQALSDSEREKGESIVELWLLEGRILLLGDKLFLHRSALTRILAVLAAKFHAQPFSVPECKAQLGLTRKFAVPLLEWLDRNGYTQRLGEQRIWLGKEVDASFCEENHGSWNQDATGVIHG